MEVDEVDLDLGRGLDRGEGWARDPVMGTGVAEELEAELKLWGLSGIAVCAVRSLIVLWQGWGFYPEGSWGWKEQYLDQQLQVFLLLPLLTDQWRQQGSQEAGREGSVLVPWPASLGFGRIQAAEGLRC